MSALAALVMSFAAAIPADHLQHLARRRPVGGRELHGNEARVVGRRRCVADREGRR